jgi:hypothetical protein
MGKIDRARFSRSQNLDAISFLFVQLCELVHTAGENKKADARLGLAIIWDENSQAILAKWEGNISSRWRQI